ncbi:microcystin degradation protein MlrC [Asanoa ferruginea]|uniref:Microcystin degradation protein MlrC n=1 Tax=Asanoa ferruginea TaxID=53367 RepID=A0A3D9ZR17_9ACTN|nr:M81 family metallopeptidase [Asanoa ferruginea]REF99607.1 microcystin degradation protein MlrC [Asanoa ferruginea]GIF53425.1 microcystinase C [Asanoa ferruginea]
MTLRVAVASIIQETNTFSPQPSAMDDFTSQGLWVGAAAAGRSEGTNTEIAGALARLAEEGVEGVAIVRAWAMSGGVLEEAALRHLRALLVDNLVAAGPVDALVLCLHGALTAAGEFDADAHLVEAARAALPPGVPVVVTHDLHANVTARVVAAADALIGFHTYPHVDQGDTGRRGADLALRLLRGGERIGTVLAKRPMLVPAESMAIADQPMRRLRALADAATAGPILDVSLFPVQPWLDVPELGFGVTVTHAGAPAAAAALADRLVGEAWAVRAEFAVDPVPVPDAIAGIEPGGGPVLLVQSADSPTSGATADSATVVAALLASRLRSLATVVDAPAVAACFASGAGGRVVTSVGATLDPRWSASARLSGVVTRTGDSPVVLTGDSMTGQPIAMGRWATVDTGTGLTVLVTERPAPTFDPAGYRHVGLEPADADVVVVRSATMYRAGFRGLYRRAVLLDLPGASTPRFDYLTFAHAPRPLYPLDGGDT